MDIKPIETHYNGYRFRSRLEARWAVFFDAAGIKYEYELEGFELPNGQKYLPDFHLPEFKAYVEIKPNGLDEQGLYDAESKCELLYSLDVEKIVLLCKGDPVDMDMMIYCTFYHDEVHRYVPWVDTAVFVDGATWVKPGMYDDGHLFLSKVEDERHVAAIAVGCPDDNFANELIPRFLIPRCAICNVNSYFETERKIARQARFEYGETPKPKVRRSRGKLAIADAYNVFINE